MAEYISFQPSDFFSTKLFTGNASAGHAITGVGFQPDWVWLKDRIGTNNHSLYDSVRGVTKAIRTSTTGAETTTSGVTAFGVDGFTVGNNAMGNAANAMVSWNWKMGTTSGLTGGSITPTGYSLNTTAGQSIIAYTGTGATATIPHGLGALPGCIIVKNLSSEHWQMYHHKIDATAPEDYTLQFSAGARFDTDTRWNDTAPTSSVFTVAGNPTVNGSTVPYIAYVFTEKKGYSKFGSYIGNGNVDGTFTYTGFRPAFIMLKNSNTGNWPNIWDSKRETFNPNSNLLYPNNNSAEGDGAPNWVIDMLSNGFKARSSNNEANGSGNTIIYAAFAEFPIVSSNNIPGVAR